MKCEIVFRPSLALEFTRVAIQHARLTDVVERKIGIRQLLFQVRHAGNQFDHALTEHEHVVTQTAQIGKQQFVATHRLSTPSGIS